MLPAFGGKRLSIGVFRLVTSEFLSLSEYYIHLVFVHFKGDKQRNMSVHEKLVGIILVDN